MKSIFKSFFSLFLLLGTTVFAQESITTDSIKSLPKAKTDSVKSKNDSIYRSLTVKLDLFTPIYTMASTSAQTAAAEVALNVNLMNRYFPAAEFGFASCNHTAPNNANYNGQGGFMRLGADFNIMKNKSSADNLFTLGVRAGMALQDFDINNIDISDDYWGTSSSAQFTDVTRFDAWVEVLAGIQVKIYKGLNMGWTLRYKYLLTKPKVAEPHAWYVPGFGRYADSLWGFNYYIGYTF